MAPHLLSTSASMLATAMAASSHRRSHASGLSIAAVDAAAKCTARVAAVRNVASSHEIVHTALHQYGATPCSLPLALAASGLAIAAVAAEAVSGARR